MLIITEIYNSEAFREPNNVPLSVISAIATKLTG